MDSTPGNENIEGNVLVVILAGLCFQIRIGKCIFRHYELDVDIEDLLRNLVIYEIRVERGRSLGPSGATTAPIPTAAAMAETAWTNGSRIPMRGPMGVKDTGAWTNGSEGYRCVDQWQ